MNHLSLFTGIGGIDLAAEWAGFQTVAFVERDLYCQKVLAKNFPGVPIYDDVTTFDGIRFRGVDLVSAGFPCQDISVANPKGKGLAGERSGLIFSALNVIKAVRPKWLVLENVRQFVNRGGDRVCAAVESLGYTVIPLLVAAGSVGAPHLRWRTFVVAYAEGFSGLQTYTPKMPFGGERGARGATCGALRAQTPGTYWGIHQPRISGVAYGVPNRVDRARALGNAVVPQQCYPILKAIADEIKGAA